MSFKNFSTSGQNNKKQQDSAKPAPAKVAAAPAPDKKLSADKPTKS